MISFDPDPQPTGYYMVSEVAGPCTISGPISFEPRLAHARIGDGWLTWSHGYSGDIYYTYGQRSVTITLPQPACAFYFYTEPNPFSDQEFLVTTDDGGSVSFVAAGEAGASFCGIYGAGLQWVTIACVSEADFAIGEFGISCACEPLYRACCFEAVSPAYCADQYDIADCIGQGGRWLASADYCAQLEPACGEYVGACCEGPISDEGYEPFQCIGDMLQWECLSVGEATNWSGGRSCSDVTFMCPGQPGVLYCPSSRDNPGFRAALSAMLDLPVDYLDTRNGTPSLDCLLGYRAVFTWANYPYADSEAFGSVLADFVDAGGRVILGQWCLPTASVCLAGRIMSPDYCPAVAKKWGRGSYNGDGVMCATLGLTSLSTDYLDLISSIQSDALADGTIGDSYAAIWRLDMSVWYSPGNLGGSYESGDWALLTYNELICEPTIRGACCDVTTATCLDDILTLDCVALGSQWRWHLGDCAGSQPACGNPGACCSILTGECTDDVLEANCPAEQFTGGAGCGELEPACGDPGCCCDWPEPGAVTAPHFAYRASCDGRFVPQTAGAECASSVFDPACGLWQPTGVLYCPANSDNARFRAELAALLAQPVDYLDASSHTPTAEILRQYAAVVTWANYPFADSVLMGDNLADYVDQGGRAILGQWCYPTARNYLAGRIMSDPAYCPVLAASGWGAGSYNGDGVQCALNGVTVLASEYVDQITELQPGASWDGTIGEGHVAIWNAAMNVWYSPGNLGGTYESGDWARLTCNEVLCRNAPGPCCNVYTAECLDGVMPLACFGLGEGWEWYFSASCATLDPACGSPGACCNVHSGECVDAVLEAMCVAEGLEPTAGATCSALAVPCGDPGCCCDGPHPGETTDPHFAYRADCEGRFLSGVLGEDCTASAFHPECGIPVPHGVLYAPSEPDNPAFRAALAALLSVQVDYWDSITATPSLDQLIPYAAVMTWVDYPYADAAAMGDTLADFVDAGGRVILGQWCRGSDRTNHLQGRIMSDPAYCPVLALITGFGAGSYNMDGVLCPHDGPFGVVGAHDTQYLDVVSSVAPDAFTDGTIGETYDVVRNLTGSVWYSPGNTGGGYGAGDWVTLTANMLTCSESPLAPCCNVLTAECLDEVYVLDCVAGGPEWRPAYSAQSCAELVPPCGQPGACCDPASGACIDDVLRAACEALDREANVGLRCDQLAVPCGDPGCCCDYPNTGQMTQPHFAFRANCQGRFIPGVYPLCGDLDASGTVDVTDYNLFLDAYATCDGQPGFAHAADLDRDGCITLVDFQAWRNCYLFPGPGCAPDAFEPFCGAPVVWFDLSVGAAAPPGELCGQSVVVPPEDPRPLYEDVTTLPSPCDTGGEILFEPALNHRRVGSGWTSWSHGYAGDLYYSNGAFSITLTMPTGTPGLYFYVEPNPFLVFNFVVQVNGTDLSDVFTADGSGGAAYVGICGSPSHAVETVMITCDSDFAIGEFGILCSDIAGACCAEWDGVCADDVMASECAAVQHYRFLAHAACDQMDPLCGEVRGACCYEEECVYQRLSECIVGDGRYAGDAVACDPNPCLCADLHVDAPGSWTGTTCGAGDNCALRAGEEVIFAVTIPYDGLWTFSLCGSDYDTYWFFGYECCTQYWSQDDSTECETGGYTRQQLAAGRYFIDLEGYDGCGSYTLTISPPLFGACCDPVGCHDGAAEAECTGSRFEPETLCSELDPPCDGGSHCYDARITAPGIWTGTTCGAADDCDLRAGEDLVVQVEIPVEGNWQFALCESHAWDTYLFLGGGCCQSTWYDDDGCGGTALSCIQLPALPAGMYYVDIEPYSDTACDDVTLAVTSYEPRPRTASSQSPAPATLEELAPESGGRR